MILRIYRNIIFFKKQMRSDWPGKEHKNHKSYIYRYVPTVGMKHYGKKCYQKTKINVKISVSLLLFCTVCIHSYHIKEHIVSFNKIHLNLFFPKIVSHKQNIHLPITLVFNRLKWNKLVSNFVSYQTVREQASEHI